MSDHTYEFLDRRGISKETHRFYNCLSKIDAEGKPIAVAYPYANSAAKIRKLDQKEFYSQEGSNGEQISAAGLFGRDRFPAGSHKYVIVTEGEDDALSCWEVLRVPSVSVQSSGCAVRDCGVDFEWLNSFERIYLAFDNDRTGKDAVRAVAKLFEPNKVYHVKWDTRKDANEYLQAGERSELTSIWKNSKQYLPESVVSSLSDFRKKLKPLEWGVPYPFKKLTEMTYGIRTGETVLITAPEKIGKTEVMHHIEHKLLTETEDNVASFFLEEPEDRHIRAIAGITLKKPVHLPDCGLSDDEVFLPFAETVRRDDRLYSYDHFGSDDPGLLLDTIRYLVVARNVRYVLFDHISLVLSVSDGDERKGIDRFSTQLEMLVKSLNFGLILVSHVNDFGQTRGSRWLGKICDIRIDLSRDKMADDPSVKNTTCFSVPDNRYCGMTGSAGRAEYDLNTCSFVELEDAPTSIF